jgi:hypothetical protein
LCPKRDIDGPARGRDHLLLNDGPPIRSNEEPEAQLAYSEKSANWIVRVTTSDVAVDDFGAV